MGLGPRKDWAKLTFAERLDIGFGLDDDEDEGGDYEEEMYLNEPLLGSQSEIDAALCSQFRPLAVNGYRVVMKF